MGAHCQFNKNEKSFWEPTFVPWGLESDDLIDLHRQFYREFYLRPTILKRHLESIQSVEDVMKYVEAASLFTFLFFDLDPEEMTSQVKEVACLQLSANLCPILSVCLFARRAVACGGCLSDTNSRLGRGLSNSPSQVVLTSTVEDPTERLSIRRILATSLPRSNRGFVCVCTSKRTQRILC